MVNGINISANITSHRKGNKIYKITNFVEYQVTMDLDEDVTGSFSLSISNTNGKYTGWFSAFDKVNLYVNGKLIMMGNIDKVQYKYDNRDHIIVIDGRDLSWKINDNDATPKKGNQKKKEETKKRFISACKRFGLKYAIKKGANPKYKGLTIGCNESEASVVRNMLADTNYKLWFLCDREYMGTWNQNAGATYTISDKAIESYNLTLDYKDVTSEMRTYDTTKKGGYKKKSTIKNPYLKNRGINRIKTHRKYSEGSTVKQRAVGQKKMKDGYIDSCTFEIKIAPSSNLVILPNICIQINSSKFGINKKMFVRKVEYFKDFDTGTEINLTLIPANTSYDNLWVGQDITTLA